MKRLALVSVYNEESTLRFNTIVQLYRSQRAVRDVFINAALDFWAFARWVINRKVESRRALARPVITSETS